MIAVTNFAVYREIVIHAVISGSEIRWKINDKRLFAWYQSITPVTFFFFKFQSWALTAIILTKSWKMASLIVRLPDLICLLMWCSMKHLVLQQPLRNIFAKVVYRESNQINLLGWTSSLQLIGEVERQIK